MNITLARDCLTQGNGLLSATIALVGFDTIMINQIFTLGAGGILENVATKEEWGVTE
jgi:hypothetical protein